MANKTNKYGRQIFLTRKDINELRGLLDSAIVGCDDFLGEIVESLEWAEETYNQDTAAMWEADRQETEERKRHLLNIKKKLFYYVEEHELEGSK